MIMQCDTVLLYELYALADMAAIVEQKQQRVAVGPGNAHFHFCSPGVVRPSHDAARHVRTRGPVAYAPMLLRRAAAAAAAATADAVCRQVGNFIINFY